MSISCFAFTNSRRLPIAIDVPFSTFFRVLPFVLSWSLSSHENDPFCCSVCTCARSAFVCRGRCRQDQLCDQTRSEPVPRGDTGPARTGRSSRAEGRPRTLPDGHAGKDGRAACPGGPGGLDRRISERRSDLAQSLLPLLK